MPGYEGSLFDANGPAQFATQIHGIADAMDEINQKATAFFQTTQGGLDDLTQSLSDFQSASGGFAPGGGGGGGSGWSAPSGINAGGTGGQQGNTVGNGGRGNTPPGFTGMTGNVPNGGEGAVTAPLTFRQMVGRGVESGIGVATGAARGYVAQTEAPNIQQQLSATQLDLSTGKSIGYTMGGIARSRYLATSQADLALGMSATQNLFGTALVGAPAGSAMAANAQTLGTSFNAIEAINPTVGLTGAAQAMSGMITPGALRAQMAGLGGMTIRQGGQYQSPDVIVNRIMQNYPQLENMDEASFEQDITSGNMYQNIMNMVGGDPTMLSTVQYLLRAARRNKGAGQGGIGAPGTLPANMTTKQAQQLGLTSPAALTTLQKQSGKAHMQAGMAQGSDQALTDFNSALRDFYGAVNSIFGAAPAAGYGLGFGAKTVGAFGGVLGTAAGMLTGGLLGGGGGGGAGGLLGGLLGGGGGAGGGGINPLDLVGAFFGVKKLSGLIGKFGSRMGGAAADAARAAGATVADAGGAVVDATSTVLGEAGGVATAVGTEAGMTTVGALGGAAAVAAPMAVVAAAVPSMINPSSISSGYAYASGMGLAPSPGATNAGSGIPALAKLPTNQSTYDLISGYVASQQNPNISKGINTSYTVGGVVPPNLRNQLVATALTLAGQQSSPANVKDVMTIIQGEDGSWNPSAVNRTDSNAKAGHPSEGLMQTIPSTFQKYALPGYNKSIDDPLSNVIAGIRYAVSRYGGLGNVPGVKAVEAGKPYVGYERGTYEIHKTTLAMLHKGERVVPASENSIVSRYNTGAGASTTHLHFHFSTGSISVSMPSTDLKTATKSGEAIADGIIAQLAKA